MALTRDQIRERLKYAQLTLSGTMASIFSSDVAERAKRNIVLIWMNGDGTARTVNVEKVKEDDTWDMIFKAVHVPATDDIEIPKSGFDIENPIIVLEGGTNLSFIASAGTPYVTVVWYDDEL